MRLLAEWGKFDLAKRESAPLKAAEQRPAAAARRRAPLKALGAHDEGHGLSWALRDTE